MGQAKVLQLIMICWGGWGRWTITLLVKYVETVASKIWALKKHLYIKPSEFHCSMSFTKWLLRCSHKSPSRIALCGQMVKIEIFWEGGGSFKIIIIDCTGKKSNKWLCDTWTAPKTHKPEDPFFSGYDEVLVSPLFIPIKVNLKQPISSVKIKLPFHANSG